MKRQLIKAIDWVESTVTRRPWISAAVGLVVAVLVLWWLL